jgi:uncharacterized lipoprotein YmbA
MRLRIRELMLLTIILSGCGSPKEYLYTLSSSTASGSTGALPASVRPSIAVGPITLPEVVDRPQMVVRVGPNQVALVEQHRWAEPLRNGIARVVAEDLAHLLGTRQVVTSYQNGSQTADYQVILDIQRFESALALAVTIDALWMVRRVTDGQTRTGRLLVRESTSGEGYDALVEAHNRALAMVSRDIAEAVRLTNSSAR